MANEENFFTKLWKTVSQPRSIGSMGFEPVFYVVYPAGKTFQAMDEMRAFQKNFEKKGYRPRVFNIYKEIWEILERNEDWSEIVQTVREVPSTVEDLQITITEIVNGSNHSALVQRLRKVLQEEKENNKEFKPVVFVVGLEALHGIGRPGTLEAQLNGEFSVPTVFFYPGQIDGSAGLSFLGFYPTDSNYRSEHLNLSELLK